jgi:hypothetical protein
MVGVCWSAARAISAKTSADWLTKSKARRSLTPRERRSSTSRIIGGAGSKSRPTNRLANRAGNGADSCCRCCRLAGGVSRGTGQRNRYRQGAAVLLAVFEAAAKIHNQLSKKSYALDSSAESSPRGDRYCWIECHNNRCVAQSLLDHFLRGALIRRRLRLMHHDAKK